MNQLLWPNPASDYAVLELPDSETLESACSDHRSSRKVGDYIKLSDTSASVQLEVSALESGIYLLQVNDAEAVPFEVSR